MASFVLLTFQTACAEESFGVDFLKKVLHSHPILVQSHKNVRAAELSLQASRLQPNPTLTLAATAGDAGESSNAITQNFETSGQPHLRWKVAQANERSAYGRLEASRRALLASAYRAWLDLWVGYQLTELAELRQNLMGETVRAAKRRYEVGEIAENEALRVELASAQAQSGLVKQRAGLRSARRNISLLLGLSPDDDSILELVPDKPPSLLVEVGLTDLLESSRLNPGIEAKFADLEAIRYGARLLSKNRAPQLGLSAYRADIFRTGQVAQGVQLSLSWPLVDWGRIARSVERKEVEAEAFQAGIEASVLALRQTLSRQWTELEAARENRDILLTQAERYRELASEARIAYDLGMMNLTDLLQTEAAFRQAGVDLVGAEADVLRLEIGLWENTGLPLPEDFAKEIL